MIRKFSYILVLISWMVTSVALAATNNTITHAKGRPYSLAVIGDYGYNSTFQHYGGGELRAFLPVNQNVEIFLNAAGWSTNVYAGSFTIRPKMPVPVGELFFDASVQYTSVTRSEIHDINFALSFGYKMDYFQAQIGNFSRTMGQYQRTWNNEESFISEPFNILYRISANVQPLCERWNLFFGVTNFNEFQYERHWQPLFFTSFYYDFPPDNSFEYNYNAASHFRLIGEVYVKPTGMFHLDASFYGAQVKFGFAYKF